MEKPEKFYILCGFTDHICNTHGRPHKTYEEALQKAKDLVRSSHPHSDTFIIMESVACVQTEPPVEPPIHVSRYDETPTKVIHKELTRKEDTPKYHETQKDEGSLMAPLHPFYLVLDEVAGCSYDDCEYGNLDDAMTALRNYQSKHEACLTVVASFKSIGVTAQGRIKQLEHLLHVNGKLTVRQQTELEKLKDQTRLEKMEEEK